MNVGIVYMLLIVNLSLHFFSTFGGLGKDATIFYSHMADLLITEAQHQLPSNTLLDALFVVLFLATFYNICHSWEQTMPASNAFCYLY